MRIDAFERVARLVGNTPLVEISQALTPARILAKLEYYNPSGSVKDRAAKGMLEAALANEELAGRTILEATSGNTGIALAMFGSALGLPVELVMPANVTPERKRIIANYGARSVFTSNLEGTDGAQRKAAELAAAHPERYFYPDQYNNEHNWRAHYGGTGPEIWRQSGGQATHFVAGLGTSGTFIGSARFLRERGVRCIAVQPDNPIHGLEGWKHMHDGARARHLRRRGSRRGAGGGHRDGVPLRHRGRPLPRLRAEPERGGQPVGGAGGGAPQSGRHRGYPVPGQFAEVPGRSVLGE